MYRSRSSNYRDWDASKGIDRQRGRPPQPQSARVHAPNTLLSVARALTSMTSPKFSPTSTGGLAHFELKSGISWPWYATLD
eukprot:scaffold4251_cov430-Prasinococcus_capsulatus_cf.AAC.3